MRFGLHISVSKGLRKAAETAIAVSAETFQVFSGNPGSWRASAYKEPDLTAFRELAEAHDLGPVFLHAPYLVNLASPRDDYHEKSVALVVNALEKAAQLGREAVALAHVGSHRGAGLESGIQRLVAGLDAAFAQAPAGVRFLLEPETGAGDEIGARFDELRTLFAAMPDPWRDRVGVCLDTAHLWGAGYDIGTPAGMRHTLTVFHRLVGLDRLWCLHANDSSKPFGSRTDEHQHPGEGQIGLEPFRALVNDPRVQDVPVILELPGETVAESRALLEGLRCLRTSPISQPPFPLPAGEGRADKGRFFSGGRPNPPAPRFAPAREGGDAPPRSGEGPGEGSGPLDEKPTLEREGRGG